MTDTQTRPPQAYQYLPALDDEQRHALRQSIEANGILQPIEVDETGRILDGHHRSAIAAELGIACPTRVVEGLDEAGKRKYAITVNLVRRQMDRTTRGALVAQLRTEGMSVRAIAAETGLTKSTVANDLAQLSNAGQLEQPERIKSLDGKERPATQPQRERPEPPPTETRAFDPHEDDPEPWPIPAAEVERAESVGLVVRPESPAAEGAESVRPVSPARPPFESSRAPEPELVDDDAAERSSAKFGEALAAMFLTLDPDPVRWVANRWRPNAFANRDLPRVRDAFTSDGLRKLGDHLYALADHLDENGVSL